MTAPATAMTQNESSLITTTDLQRTFDKALVTLRRLAATAHLAAPGFAATSKTKRIGEVKRRPDGLWVVIQPVLLTAPELAIQFVLAHEIAHIALRHPAVRRRQSLGAAAAIPLISVVFIGVLIVEIPTWNWWSWLITMMAWLSAMLVPRAVLLAVFRQHEYRADRLAVQLLGSAEPGAAFFDWVATVLHVRKPLVARLWMATHPSNAARRQALSSGA